MSDNKELFCWARKRIKKGDKVQVIYNSCTAYDGLTGEVDQIAGEEVLIVFSDNKGSDWLSINDIELKK